MRLFLAINLPPASKKRLDQQLKELQNEYPQFNWVARENFHITILFFGETDRVDWIKRKIEEAIYDVSSFRLYSQGADLFLNKKIVLYVYFRREKKVEELESKIKKIFQIKETKKFIPHLTIARFRVPSKQQYFNLKKKLRQLPIELDFTINKIYLVQTLLTTKKPVYKKIASFSLLKQLRS